MYACSVSADMLVWIDINHILLTGWLTACLDLWTADELAEPSAKRAAGVRIDVPPLPPWMQVLICVGHATCACLLDVQLAWKINCLKVLLVCRVPWWSGWWTQAWSRGTGLTRPASTCEFTGQ